MNSLITRRIGLTSGIMNIRLAFWCICIHIVVGHQWEVGKESWRQMRCWPTVTSKFAEMQKLLQRKQFRFVHAELEMGFGNDDSNKRNTLRLSGMEPVNALRTSCAAASRNSWCDSAEYQPLWPVQITLGRAQMESEMNKELLLILVWYHRFHGLHSVPGCNPKLQPVFGHFLVHLKVFLVEAIRIHPCSREMLQI